MKNMNNFQPHPSAEEKSIKNEKFKSDFDTLKPMSLEEFNSRIDLSIDDSKNERIIEQEELKAKIEKWS